MNPMVVGLGEVLWDVLPEGERLGGAPANFAFHASQLGADGRLVSRVGDDRLGRETLRLLREHGLDAAGVSLDPLHPTGRALARLKNGAATYEFPDDSAWDHLALTPEAERLARKATAVCFGTLAQRSPVSRAMIRAFLGSFPPDCLRILDPNLRGDYYGDTLLAESLEAADVLKLSDEELDVLSQMFGVSGTDAQRLAGLARRFGLRLAAMTRGGRGAVIVGEEGVSDHPGIPAEVVDTIGAGDSFTASLAVGLLAGLDLDAINDRANRVAAAVCARAGAMAEIPAGLRIL